jgi:hypothetical protein
MYKITTLALALGVALAGVVGAAMFTNGATLLEARCALCHPSSKVKVLKRTPGQWDAIVTGMVKKGAKLNSEEKQTLVEYLAKTYKP